MIKTAVALGTFDGIHSGHKAVLKAALESGFEPAAVIFPVPPKVMMGDSSGILMSTEEKMIALKEMGFSKVHFLDFQKIRDYSPEKFLDYLRNNFNCAFISCGFNYHFGKNGAGNTAFLSEYCKKNGIELSIIQPVKINGEIVCSTLIRKLLQNGEVNKANEMCLKPFGFSSEIVHGDARGRTIGFPTVNQIYPEKLCRVKFGVYKSEITVNGKKYKGITNIGIRPTYKNDFVSAETYILNFSGDIYGAVADLRLMGFIRPEQKFEDIESLKSAIGNDVKALDNEI